MMTKYDFIQITRLHYLFRPFFSGIGHVLLFHRVWNENEYSITKNLQVSQEYLGKVIQYFINNNIDIVSMEECYKRITSKRKQKRFVVFTFDDGYADNMTHALPVFEKYNAPFNLFLSTGFPDHQVFLWWYLLEDFIMKNEKVEFINDNKVFSYDTSSANKKIDAFWKIRLYIMESSQKNLLSRLKSILGEDEDELINFTKKMALSWEQVIELSKHPLVTIGAHTVNHLALSKLKEDEVYKEITDSVKLIEKKIHTPVQYFAYPLGSSNEAGDREFDIAKNCNIKMAFTTRKGNILKQHVNSLYSLPRISINEGLKISNIDFYVNGLTPFRDKYFK